MSAEVKELRPFFEVDRGGLAKLQGRRGKNFAVLELLQNALDENVSAVAISLEPIPGQAKVRLRVEDDSPEGFKSLSHAYTLFADSEKRADPSKRGRFTLGEKLVLAICDEARIHTTTGTVIFDGRGRREYPRRRRHRGSLFEGLARMTRQELDDALARLELVLIPSEVDVTVNGKALAHRTALRTFEATLPTEIAGTDGVMRRSERRSKVKVVEPAHGERPYLFELGLPVMEIPGCWHVDVGQRIPLGMERDSVSSSYLRRLSAEVVANAYELISDEDSRADWVGDALASGRLPAAAVDRILTGRYGERRVSADPSDPEGTKLAVSEGYEVIPSGAFSRSQWQAIRDSGAVKPAGQVTPSPRPYSDDPNARVRRELPADQITDGMTRICELTERLGAELLPEHVGMRVVLIDDLGVRARATFGPVGGSACMFEYNVASLGRSWFEEVPVRAEVLALIIHELAHWFSGDHLSSSYHRALCQLGAQLTVLALADPARFATDEA